MISSFFPKGMPKPIFLTAGTGLQYPTYDQLTGGLRNLKSSFSLVTFFVDDGILRAFMSKLSSNSINFSFYQSSNYSIFERIAPIGTFQVQLPRLCMLYSIALSFFIEDTCFSSSSSSYTTSLTKSSVISFSI